MVPQYYNASHLFGFFSVFNANAIKNVQLTKAGFPARYGGRLSSVLEVDMKDGNMKTFEGEGSVGLIASQLTLQGPLRKDRDLVHCLGPTHVHRSADSSLPPQRREGRLPLLRSQCQTQPHFLAREPGLPESLQRGRPLLERFQRGVRRRQLPRGGKRRCGLRLGQRHLNSALEPPLRQPALRQFYCHL